MTYIVLTTPKLSKTILFCETTSKSIMRPITQDKKISGEPFGVFVNRSVWFTHWACILTAFMQMIHNEINFMFCQI
jgi:hypothetical protein